MILDSATSSRATDADIENPGLSDQEDADLAGGDLLALLLDDADDVLRRQTPRLKQVQG